jgi:hypothetical protein
METDRHKALAAATSPSRRSSKKIALLVAGVLVVLSLGGALWSWLTAFLPKSSQERVEMIDGLAVYFNKDGSAITKIRTKGKDIKMGVSLEQVINALGKPLDTSKPNQEGEFIAQYYVGRNYINLHFKDPDRPRLTCIYIHGGY